MVRASTWLDDKKVTKTTIMELLEVVPGGSKQAEHCTAGHDH